MLGEARGFAEESTLHDIRALVESLSDSKGTPITLSDKPQSPEGKLYKQLESGNLKMDLIAHFVASSPDATINVFHLVLKLIENWSDNLDNSIYFGEDDLTVCKIAKHLNNVLKSSPEDHAEVTQTQGDFSLPAASDVWK